MGRYSSWGRGWGGFAPYVSVAELEEYISAVGEERVAQVCRGLEEKYMRLPGIEDEKFAASVRATLGMERLAHS